jgi:hypothetical protein
VKILVLGDGLFPADAGPVYIVFSPAYDMIS